MIEGFGGFRSLWVLGFCFSDFFSHFFRGPGTVILVFLWEIGAAQGKKNKEEDVPITSEVGTTHRSFFGLLGEGDSGFRV